MQVPKHGGKVGACKSFSHLSLKQVMGPMVSPGLPHQFWEPERGREVKETKVRREEALCPASITNDTGLFRSNLPMTSSALIVSKCSF